MRKLTLCFVLLIMVSACSGVSVDPHTDSAPLPVPEGVKPRVIGLSSVKILLPRGEKTIGFGPKGMAGMIDCDLPWGAMDGISVGNFTDTTQVRKQFSDTLEVLGYDVVGNPGLLFNQDEDNLRIRYRVGARVTDVKIDACSAHNFFPALRVSKGIRGEANLTVDWVVYDGLLKKTVYKTTTVGYADLDTSMAEGISILLEEALGSAIHELGTDQQFHDLVFKGIVPQQSDGELGLDAEKLPTEDWSESLRITTQKPFGKDFKSMQKATVLIESGSGAHGSGFFIADDLIITNAHVVGFADTLRVTLSGKTDYMLARLVRTDRPRDIAVLRLVEKPKDASFYKIASLYPTQPELGDTVYVVGAPYYKKLQDTLVSGIVSGLRYDSKRRQTYIQSDALIHGGNSGGPMFDDKGRVIGVSVEGYINQDGDPLAGLNWFIPIGDALTKLDIETK